MLKRTIKSINVFGKKAELHTNENGILAMIIEITEGVDYIGLLCNRKAIPNAKDVMLAYLKFFVKYNPAMGHGLQIDDTLYLRSGVNGFSLTSCHKDTSFKSGIENINWYQLVDVCIKKQTAINTLEECAPMYIYPSKTETLDTSAGALRCLVNYNQIISNGGLIVLDIENEISCTLGHMSVGYSVYNGFEYSVEFEILQQTNEWFLNEVFYRVLHKPTRDQLLQTTELSIGDIHYDVTVVEARVCDNRRSIDRRLFDFLDRNTPLIKLILTKSK